MKEYKINSGYIWSFFLGCLIFLILLIIVSFNTVNERYELASAICNQQNPIHQLEFAGYNNKILYCKLKLNETKYDGIKIRIGD